MPQVGSLVEAEVTAVRLYWVELELCSIISAPPAGASCSSSSTTTTNAISSSSRCSLQGAVAGMRGSITALHLSAAPVGDLGALLAPGDRVRVSVGGCQVCTQRAVERAVERAPGRV